MCVLFVMGVLVVVAGGAVVEEVEVQLSLVARSTKHWTVEQWNTFLQLFAATPGLDLEISNFPDRICCGLQSMDYHWLIYWRHVGVYLIVEILYMLLKVHPPNSENMGLWHFEWMMASSTNLPFYWHPGWGEHPNTLLGRWVFDRWGWTLDL